MLNNTLKNKKCSKCNKEKNINLFRFVAYINYYRNECKECEKEYNKNYKKKKVLSGENKKNLKKFYLKNKKRILEKSKKYRNENKEKFLLIAAKNRAKKNNLEFNLELKDIIILDFCPVLNVKYNFNGTFKNSMYAPSIDRINNSKGYIKDNIQIISYRANLIKSNGTLEEFEKLLEWMKTGKFLCTEYTNDKLIKRKINYLLSPSIRKKSNNQFILSKLDKEEIISNIPLYCPILGIKLSFFNKKANFNSPSIDRINNSKGYLKENIQIISWRANKLKKDASMEEIEAIVNYMKVKI